MDRSCTQEKDLFQHDDAFQIALYLYMLYAWLSISLVQIIAASLSVEHPHFVNSSHNSTSRDSLLQSPATSTGDPLIFLPPTPHTNAPLLYSIARELDPTHARATRYRVVWFMIYLPSATG
jgi:hypothetical protein